MMPKVLGLGGRIVVVAATLVCLASIGGAMLVAWPVLVSLHWYLARDAGPKATAGWALLAASSLAEATAMWVYVLSGEGWMQVTAAGAVFVATATAFLRRGARRYAPA